jgi:hypothetical protein
MWLEPVFNSAGRRIITIGGSQPYGGFFQNILAGEQAGEYEEGPLIKRYLFFSWLDRGLKFKIHTEYIDCGCHGVAPPTIPELDSGSTSL